MADRPFSVASFDRFLGEKKLMASRCTSCGRVDLPPRAICPACYAEQPEWVELAGQGTLAAFTSVYVVPTFMAEEGFDRNHPYCTGIVALAEGPQISARLLGVDARAPAAIRIGSPVTVEYVERGEGEARKTYLAFRVSAE